jgi:hypothetical protein
MALTFTTTTARVARPAVGVRPEFDTNGGRERMKVVRTQNRRECTALSEALGVR